MFSGFRLNGLRVFAVPEMVDRRTYQYRFPRSKKWRIRKKWTKDGLNFRTDVTPMDHFLVSADAAYAHPSLIEQLKRQIAKNEEGHFQQWG